MKKSLILITYLFLSTSAQADNVILMIGDGMGDNHLKCAAQDKTIFTQTLPIKGWIQTHSANHKITDSAAAATAYSCGYKTNNKTLGKLPNGRDYPTIAEQAIQKGLSVGIYSTDHSTGATPSAFFAHAFDRYDKKTIKAHKDLASKTMDIVVPIEKISEQTEQKLNTLNLNKKGFFAMFEGAHIDTKSHQNNLNLMKEELYDFDLAVKNAVNFAKKHPDTTVIVLADHETGGLTNECKYTSPNHTGVDVPVYAYGKHKELFKDKQENVEIYQKIHNILFNKTPSEK